MWANYIKEIESWQIKTLLYEHNCMLTYKNKLVSVKYLVQIFGDRIRKITTENCERCKKNIKEFTRLMYVKQNIVE